MGGLLDGLYTGYSGLAAAQTAVELTGHNIANANTEGFHRRRVELAPLSGPSRAGGGVAVQHITRVDDVTLQRQVQASLAESGWATAHESVMLRVEQAVGDVSADNLGSRLDRLFNAFSALAASPQSLTVRNDALGAAGDVAQSLRRAASALDHLAEAADRDISASVDGVNARLRAVAELNAQIGRIEAGGGSSGDLMDERDRHLDGLAQAIGARAFADDMGQTSVLLDGVTLVQADHAAQLRVAPEATGGSRSRLLVVDGGLRLDVTSRTGGEIGGRTEARDRVIPELSARLDQLAFEVATAVNATHRAGVGLDGIGARDLFSIPATSSSAAAQISLAPGLRAEQLAAAAGSSGLPGDNENALALAGLQQRPIANGGTATVTSAAARLVGDVGAATKRAQADAAALEDERVSLEAIEQSRSGVSPDEEMVRLVQYQRVYQASAKVVQVVDGLMEELLRIR